MLNSHQPFSDLFEIPLRNGLTKPKSLRGAGIKMVNMGEIFAHRRIRNLEMDRVPMEPNEFENSLLKNGDLLFARQSLVLSGAGKCVLYQGDDEPVTFESHIIRCRLDAKKSDSGYYFYLFQSRLGRSLIESIIEQVAASGIRGSDLARLKVPVPPLSEQKRIAHILGTLDDKIELNRKMNATLEAMARALFKSWFVDFDPVRAKMEGRQPEGMDAETAALFPDEFEESELGLVPKGWTVDVLDDLIESVIGGDWGESEATSDATVPCFCIRGADIPSLQEGGLGKMPIRFLKPSSVQKRQLLAGDIAIEISGGSPTQCTGRPVLISQALLHSLDNPLVASNFCRIVKLKSPVLSKFVYCWLRTLYDSDLLFQFETGTTGIKNFGFVRFAEAYPLINAGGRITKAFDNTVSPLFAQINANAAESRSIAKIREALLPKLLHGVLGSK